MGYFWFWAVVFFGVVMLLALPVWPYSRERWRYGPSGAALAAIAIILFAAWFGFVALWWPWFPVAGRASGVY